MKREEWQKLFDDAGWREKVSAGLREIAGSRDADPFDRQAACALWSELVFLKLVPGPKGSVEEMIRDVHIDLLLRRTRNDGVAKELHDLLAGVRGMVTLALQFADLSAFASVKKPAEITSTNLSLN